MTELHGLPVHDTGHPLIVLQGTESGVLASISDWLALAAAVSGVVGTIILFVASYAATDRKIRGRLRTGLAFLCLSFVLQAALVLLV